jgi:hypothetical protein
MASRAPRRVSKGELDLVAVIGGLPVSWGVDAVDAEDADEAFSTVCKPLKDSTPKDMFPNALNI